jgi:DICT domain-containing protein
MSTIVAATYARRTIDRVAEAAIERDPERADWASWSLVFYSSLLSILDVRGHGDAILAAADDLARQYGLPTESREVGTPANLVVFDAPTLAEAVGA